jgi:hypothetical protein
LYLPSKAPLAEDCCACAIRAVYAQRLDPRFELQWSHVERSATSQLLLASLKPVLGSFAEALWIMSISRSNVSTMRG